MKIRLKEYEVGEGTYFQKCRAYLDTETGNIEKHITLFPEIKKLKFNLVINESGTELIME